jgi:hypothetical protein
MLRRFRENQGSFEVMAWVDPRVTDRDFFDRETSDIHLKRRFGFFLRPVKHLCSLDSHESLKVSAYRCQKCISIYSLRSEDNWTRFQSLLDYCSATEERRWLKIEYTSGSDLYHGLGSARSAVLVSLFASIVYALIGWISGLDEMPKSFGLVIVAAISAAALVFAEYFLLSRCRDELSRNYEGRTASGLAFVSKDLYPGHPR